MIISTRHRGIVRAGRDADDSLDHWVRHETGGATPGDEEASMSSPDGVRAFADLERNTGEIVEAMRLTIRLLRALAPLAVEMRELQGALLQLQEATGAGAHSRVSELPAASGASAAAAD